MILKTLWYVKEDSHKRPYFIGFHFYEMSGIGKSMDKENSRPRAGAGWSSNRGLKVITKGHGVSSVVISISKMDRGVGCKIL